MNKYRRFFRVSSGPLIDAIETCIKINYIGHRQYLDILEEIGAKPEYYHRDGKLVSFEFEETPDKDKYKKMCRNTWYPKRNNKWGKDLHARIKDVRIEPVSNALEAVGISKDFQIFDSSTFNLYIPALLVSPYEPLVAIVSVPWYDEDPEKMVNYISDRIKGGPLNQNLESLSWVPTKDMEEIKEWEAKKEIDKWNMRK